MSSRVNNPVRASNKRIGCRSAIMTGKTTPAGELMVTQRRTRKMTWMSVKTCTFHQVFTWT